MIANIRKNIMGTCSFNGQFSGMRKPQDFIVYPMREAGDIIRIQAKGRFGELNLATGELVLSTKNGRHAGNEWLAVCVAMGTAITEILPIDEIQAIRLCVKSTGGIAVGSSFVKSDNTGALAL